MDLNEILYDIITTEQDISINKYYGIGTLCDVLLGTESKTVFDDALHKTAGFGSLKPLGYEIVQAVIEWMLTEHLLLKTKGNHPVLHSTYEGLHYSEVMSKTKIIRLKEYL